MKKLAYVFIGVASFAGVFLALQTDRWLEKRRDSAPVEYKQDAALMPIQYSGPVASPPDFRQAAKKVMPSVVAIDRFERVADMFGYERGVRETGSGSGVIISANGTIVTNNHVVADTRTGQAVERVKVRLDDKRTFDAKVLGTDPRSDLAVLKIEAPNLVPVEMGDSTSIEVGQWVLAIGNPLGFDNTVSAGVVSSLKRDLPVGFSGLVNAIQTDAAINPGNSGGALTDANGRLIGVNSAIASTTGQNVGIGFAIPIDRVKQVVNDIVKFGYAKYAGLGVSYDGRLSGALAYPQFRQEFARQMNAENVPSQGIIVGEASGAAAAANIKEGDIIMEIDGTPIEDSFTLNKVLTPRKPGEKVRVKYWTRGKVETTTLTLQEVRSVRNP